MGITSVVPRRRQLRARRAALAALLLTAALVLGGCASIEATIVAAKATPSGATGFPIPTPSPTPPPVVNTARMIPIARPPTGTPQMGSPLSNERVAEIMNLLLQRDPDPATLEQALEEIVQHRDVRFVAPLIELMRAGPMQLAELDQAHVEALEDLTGWSHSRPWDRWIEWYGTTELDAPPGFADWKGELLSRLDPRYGEFVSSAQPSTIRVEGLVWSGIPPDGRPPLDAPAFVAGDSAEADYLDLDEPVFGVYVNGEARAYPLRIMDVHEIANDVVGGVPVALTYCTLTGSATMYDRHAPDGETYDFTGSGLVHESSRLMYDRQTETLWNPVTGRPVLGALVDAAAGTEGPWLAPIPIVTTRWGNWLATHPDTLVLSFDQGFGSHYTLGFPHLEYFASGDTAYPVSERDHELLTKAWVYGITSGSVSEAYPVRDVVEAGVVNDRVGDLTLALVGEGRGRGIRISVEAPMYGEMKYFVGDTVRAYDRPDGITFSRGATPEVVVDQHGEEWRVTEDALISPDGQVAPRIWGQMMYWFGWHAFHPETGVNIPRQPIASAR